MTKLIFKLIVADALVFLLFGACGGMPPATAGTTTSSAPIVDTCPKGKVCCPNGGTCQEFQTCDGNWCVDEGMVECTDSKGNPKGEECPASRGCCLAGCCL